MLDKQEQDRANYYEAVKSKAEKNAANYDKLGGNEAEIKMKRDEEIAQKYVIEQEKVNKRKEQEKQDKRANLQRSCNDAMAAAMRRKEEEKALQRKEDERIAKQS